MFSEEAVCPDSRIVPPIFRVSKFMVFFCRVEYIDRVVLVRVDLYSMKIEYLRKSSGTIFSHFPGIVVIIFKIE
jgi:hypothetical protein